MTTYAITQTSGKQFLLKPNYWYDIDFINLLGLKEKKGEFLTLDKILFLKNEEKIQLGYPFLKKSKILCQFLAKVKGKKITVLKTKPKKKYTRTQGHRQKFTRIHICK